MNNFLLRILGWKALVLHGDTLVVDRWSWLSRHLRSGSLRTLDAGCGNGCFTLYAAKLGNEVVGLNFDEEPNVGARYRANLLGITGAQFRQADLRELNTLAAGLGSFDQILCMECIEHILNDQKLIMDLSALLKPGGRLLLTAPYKNHKPLRNEQLSDKEDGGHVRWGYTHEELRHIFIKAGLDVESEEYISGFIAQKLTSLARAFGLSRERLGWAVVFPLRILKVFDRPVTQLLNFPHLSVGVVAAKRS